MTPADEPAIVALFQAEDLAHRGRTDFTPETFHEQFLAHSAFDADADLVVAEADGTLIAVALFIYRMAIICVAPDREDPGLRGELIDWTERRQTELGRTPLRVASFAAFTSGVAALRARGYQLERVYAEMIREFAVTGPPAKAVLPDGYTLKPIDPVVDAEVIHALNERAFSEREDHEPDSLEDFVRSHLSFSQFEPAWSLWIAAADGSAAGSLIGWRPPDHPHGYVALLAVDPAHRRHGLGRTMLLSAFAAIHAAGLPSAELHVAFSDNAKALELYESVGMHDTERLEHYVRTP